MDKLSTLMKIAKSVRKFDMEDILDILKDLNQVNILRVLEGSDLKKKVLVFLQREILEEIDDNFDDTEMILEILDEIKQIFGKNFEFNIYLCNYIVRLIEKSDIEFD